MNELGGKRRLTEIVLFYDTPMTDYQNTIHFASNKERDRYFLNDGHFPTYKFESDFNFIRDRLEVRVPIEYHKLNGVNYCTFISDFEDFRYYAFVNKFEYLNDGTCQISLVIDVIMTFTQGDILEKNLGKVTIQRQHLPNDVYEYMLPVLRNNDDVIKASNKSYVLNKFEQFHDNYVLWQSSADLRKKFGTKEKPNLDSSQGTTYDLITSPVDIYIMDYASFNAFMDDMSKYPWITQNFQKIQLIPKQFIDSKDMQKVEMKEDVKGDLYTLKKNSSSRRWELGNLTTPFKELGQIAGVDVEDEPHLIRNEYLTIELYDWNGNDMFIDAGNVPTDIGLRFNTRSLIGYFNEVRVYPEHFNSDDRENVIRSENNKIIIDKGAFLNKSMVFDDFVQVPILIDNGILGQSQQANKRQLAEDRLVSGRLNNLTDPTSSAKSKFFDATSLLSNLNPTQLFSKFNEDYEFYRDQQAEFKDMALQPPTVTESNKGNAFQIANGLNGLTMKFGAMSMYEYQKVSKYYKMFGFNIEEHNAMIQPLDSMSVCNYLMVEGNYHFPDIDNALMEQMRALLQSGVRFWHPDGTSNPFNQDVFKNKRVK